LSCNHLNLNPVHYIRRGSMKVGLRLPQTDERRATKENIINLAKGAENADFDSLWVLERLIWPTQSFQYHFLLHSELSSLSENTYSLAYRLVC
jgi:alkanesulfonate monooxygenase SsuD/methylene tetrahydromethanopterin reductase-like flavin-dependent oxidoreductase (luciferase family)